MVNFLYFGLVLVFTMFTMHPALLLVSLAVSLAYQSVLKGGRDAARSLRYLLPVMLLAAVVNPAFNHEGATILAYLPSGNPLTLESILYGLAAAAMLAAVLSWFACYTEVMTSDKFVYLFGRVIPALSLVLSMTLRFVPKFKAQFKVVREAQRCIGRDTDNGSMLLRMKNAVTILSIMVTWSLENAIETADSMKSRGYGLPGRTAFSIYAFDDRDKGLTLWMLACGFFLLCGALTGNLSWSFYPVLRGAELTPLSAAFPVAFLALCLTPVILDGYEALQWKRRARSAGEETTCTKV